jgi:hypothetical protein
MPDVNCEDQVAEISADGSSMSPGTWDDKFPPEGVSTLEAGVYCLKDGLEINGGQSLEGHNITLKVEAGKVAFEGNANVNIDAATTGKNKGLLLYLPMENSSAVILGGGSASSLRGTILAPASEIVINGSASIQSQIIGYRVEVDGNSNIVIVYNNDQNYDAVTMPEVQLSQ